LSSERAAKMDALLKEMEYDASLETTFTMKHNKHYIMIVIWMGKGDLYSVKVRFKEDTYFGSEYFSYLLAFFFFF
jgi:hypothetical protein